MKTEAKIAIIFIILLLSSLRAAAASYLVQGIVRDSVTDSPLPRASIVVPGGRSAVADDRGLFEIAVSPDNRSFQVGCLGYKTKTVDLRRTSHNMYVVYLSPESHQLDEVVVRKGKYTKKNNPAVDFARRIKQAGPETDPMLQPNYSFAKYERISLAVNNFDIKQSNGLLKEMPDLVQHVDTSDVTGRPILGIMLKERASHVYNRHPGSSLEVVEGIRTSGVDELIDPEAMQVFLRDALREIDLYQSDVNLLRNRFVSPLSSLAPDFYRFYLTDTINMAGDPCAVLSFYPRNKTSFGFNGHLYVSLADSTMFVRKVEMRLPEGTAVNFVDNLYITQSFSKGSNGMRLKDKDDLVIELSAFGGGKGGNLYARRTTSYSGHDFAPVPDSIFAGEGGERTLADADVRDSIFWQHVRTNHLTRGQGKIDSMMQRLRSNRLFYWGERILRVAFTGYVTPWKKAPFDIGPVNTLLSFNSVEGTRLRLGGMTTSNLSKRWFGAAYAAYGFRDHRWKYSTEIEWSFIDKKIHAREFPVRSIQLLSRYDIERPGVHYTATSADNIVLSWQRKDDDHALYRLTNRLNFTWETRTNFYVTASTGFDRFSPTRTMPFLTGNGQGLIHYDQSIFQVSLRYAPGEKFVQGRLHRIPVNFDAPAITLSHTCSPEGLFGSRYSINRTVLEIQARQWLSAFGYIDMSADAAHVWGAAPFPSLLIPNANLSYTIQPRSFALVNPMEFICSTAASWDVSYHANGALLNLIPGVKKAHLREMVGFRGYWGRLDSSCDPAGNPRLLQFPGGIASGSVEHTPYMELSVGVENIFRVLRLEYVWRLSHRNVSYSIDRSGLRFAVQIDF